MYLQMIDFYMIMNIDVLSKKNNDVNSLLDFFVVIILLGRV